MEIVIRDVLIDPAVAGGAGEVELHDHVVVVAVAAIGFFPRC
jgi:hypothetical protein